MCQDHSGGGTFSLNELSARHLCNSRCESCQQRYDQNKNLTFHDLSLKVRTQRWEPILTVLVFAGSNLPNDQPMVSKTRHRWTVVDAPKERFARITTLAVDVLEPIRPQP
jgi:hypothetical protein